MPPILEIKQPSSDPTVNVALDTLEKNKQALVFVSSKRGAEKQAEEIAKKVKVSLAAHKDLASQALKALSRPTPQCERLAECLEKGIAFHHAGLHSSQKTLVEDAFRSGAVRIICSTPTLAMGIDLPAYRAIIRDLKRYSGRLGMAYIQVLEYLQMVGRAGRPSFDTHGQGITIAKSEGEAEEIKRKFIQGEPESIYSKLAVEPVLRTYLLSLIAANVVRSQDQILEFFSKTFWAHQYHDMGELGFKITKTLKQLVDWEFLRSPQGGQASDFVSGDEMLNEIYTATPLGKRVAELYLDPYTARNFVVALRRAQTQSAEKSNGINDFSFLHLVANTLEMRPLLSIKVKEWDILQEEALRYQPYVLENEPSVYEPDFEDYLQATKTALMFRDWIEEKDDVVLMETFDVRPGESRAKLGIADWLLGTLVELSQVLELRDLIKHINKTRIRIEHGIKEELIALIKLRGIGRVRARKLFNNKIKDLGDIRTASLTTLEQLIGKETAKKIKDQVESPEEPIPKGTRKGQLSMERFE
ncbi:MAG TPA: helicase-related protein [Candidatus Nanoarchaeia archaeon]|nr:helicase-related protein [Candidatus Nanoarchaeia archaeon]